MVPKEGVSLLQACLLYTSLLNSREIDAFFQEEVFTPIHELNGRDIRYCDFRESQNWFQLRKYYLSKQLLFSVSLDTYAPPGIDVYKRQHFTNRRHKLLLKAFVSVYEAGKENLLKEILAIYPVFADRKQLLF